MRPVYSRNSPPLAVRPQGTVRSTVGQGLAFPRRAVMEEEQALVNKTATRSAQMVKMGIWSFMMGREYLPRVNCVIHGDISVVGQFESPSY